MKVVSPVASFPASSSPPKEEEKKPQEPLSQKREADAEFLLGDLSKLEDFVHVEEVNAVNSFM